MNSGADYKCEITLQEALDRAIKLQNGNTIGVLAEKTLHRTLKLLLCPDVTKHEIKYRGFVADILWESNGITHVTEIQTRQTYKLARKLEAYGEDTRVTVVIPVFSGKHVIWTDGNEEMSRPHKTSRPKNVFHGIAELYSLREYINRDNIEFLLMLLDVDEYRFLNGWSKDKKRGSERCNVVPKKVNDIVSLSCAADYIDLLPEGIDEFTADEFARATRLSLTDARCVILVLAKMNIVAECGRAARKKLWKRVLK